MGFEAGSATEILSQNDALEKAKLVYLGALEIALSNGYSREVFLNFFNLYKHYKKYQAIYGFSDSEAGINLKEICAEVAAYFLSSIKKLRKRSGADQEIKWLDEVLKLAGMSYADIQSSAGEIESLKP